MVWPTRQRYIDDVVYYDVLDGHGIGKEPLAERKLYRYLKSQHIDWLADADFEGRLGVGEFFGTVTEWDQYEVVWRDSRSIDWHEREGRRRWAVIQLHLRSAEKETSGGEP